MKGAFVSTLNKKGSNLQSENELRNDVSIAIKYKKDEFLTNRWDRQCGNQTTIGE